LDLDREIRFNQSLDNIRILINVSDITLNCVGFTSINFELFPFGGITNFTLENCVFNNLNSSDSMLNLEGSVSEGYFSFSTFRNLSLLNITSPGKGIYFDGELSHSNIFSDILFRDVGIGVSNEEADNNTFVDLTFSGTSSYSFRFSQTITGNVISNSIFNTSSGYHIYFFSISSQNPANNVFYNNVFYSTPNIASSNWSLTPNSFNLSGQGNTYYGLTGGGVICFDEPLNQTCDYFASPLVVSASSTTSSLFPFSGFFSLFIIFFGLVLFLR
jgi:hypothetical protein